MSEPRSREEALESLLKQLFGWEELRRFLARGQEGRSLASALPEHTSLDHGAHLAVDQLLRRGLVNSAFFHALRGERRGRAREVDAVRALFGEATDLRGPVELHDIVGAWVGTWSLLIDQDAHEVGEIEFLAAGSGMAIGTLTNSTGGTSLRGPLRGTVSAGGAFAASYSYVGTDLRGSIEGVLSWDGEGRIWGLFSAVDQDGGEQPAKFRLRRA